MEQHPEETELSLGGEALRSQLLRLRDDKKYCDVTIHTHGYEFDAHKCILSNSSLFFNILLNKSAEQGDTNSTENIHLVDILPEDIDNIENILCFLYGGLITINQDNFISILRLANYFVVSNLHDLLGKYMRQNLVTSNCLHWYLDLHEWKLDVENGSGTAVSGEQGADLVQQAWEMVERHFYSHIIVGEDIFKISCEDMLHILSEDITKHFCIEKVLGFLQRWLAVRTTDILIAETFLSIICEKLRCLTNQNQPEIPSKTLEYIEQIKTELKTGNFAERTVTGMIEKLDMIQSHIESNGGDKDKDSRKERNDTDDGKEAAGVLEETDQISLAGHGVDTDTSQQEHQLDKDNMVRYYNYILPGTDDLDLTLVSDSAEEKQSESVPVERHGQISETLDKDDTNESMRDPVTLVEESLSNKPAGIQASMENGTNPNEKLAPHVLTNIPAELNIPVDNTISFDELDTQKTYVNMEMDVSKGTAVSNASSEMKVSEKMAVSTEMSREPNVSKKTNVSKETNVSRETDSKLDISKALVVNYHDDSDTDDMEMSLSLINKKRGQSRKLKQRARAADHKDFAAVGYQQGIDQHLLSRIEACLKLQTDMGKKNIKRPVGRPKKSVGKLTIKLEKTNAFSKRQRRSKDKFEKPPTKLRISLASLTKAKTRTKHDQNKQQKAADLDVPEVYPSAGDATSIKVEIDTDETMKTDFVENTDYQFDIDTGDDDDDYGDVSESEDEDFDIDKYCRMTRDQLDLTKKQEELYGDKIVTSDDSFDENGEHNSSKMANVSKAGHRNTKQKRSHKESTINQFQYIGLDIDVNAAGEDFKENGLTKKRKTAARKRKKLDLECEICQQKFSRKYRLKDHMLAHVGKKRYHCVVCGQSFTRNDHVVRHMQRKHSEMTTFDCDVCGLTFTEIKSVVDHVSVHVQQSEADGGELTEHLSEQEKAAIVGKVLESGKREYECKFCNKVFKKLYNAREHSYTHLDYYSFNCDLCDRTFKRKDELSRHMKMVHNDDSIILTCPKCKKRFIQPEIYQNHVDKCERHHKCDKCKATFYGASKLKKHKESVHEKRVYLCDLCPKQFSSRSRLNSHIKFDHEGLERPKKNTICDICGLSFSGTFKLKRHMSVHTGEKAHKCEHCDKQYLDGTSLKNHVLTVHLQVKPFVCEICAMEFTVKSNMLRHLRRHRGELKFFCDECGKGFVANCDLTRHKMTHRPEKETKKHACQYCGKMFARSSKVIVHERIHTGEKPYECSVCGKRFTQSGDRTRHEVKAHDIQHTPKPTLYSMANDTTAPVVNNSGTDFSQLVTAGIGSNLGHSKT